MHVEQGGYGPQRVLAGVRLVIDVGLGQRSFSARALFGLDRDPLGVDHPVHPVDTRLHRHPAEQVQQPTRRDGGKLGNSLCRVRELPGSKVAKCL